MTVMQAALKLQLIVSKNLTENSSEELSHYVKRTLQKELLDTTIKKANERNDNKLEQILTDLCKMIHPPEETSTTTQDNQ